jgi:hypothetical protein
VILPLEAPVLLSDPSQTRVGLIANSHSLEAFEVLNDSLQKSRRGDVGSSLGLHWLIDQHPRLVARRSLHDVLNISLGLLGIRLGQGQSNAVQLVNIGGAPRSQVGDCPCIPNQSVIPVPEAIDIFLLSEDPGNHE